MRRKKRLYESTPTYVGTFVNKTLSSYPTDVDCRSRWQTQIHIALLQLSH